MGLTNYIVTEIGVGGTDQTRIVTEIGVGGTKVGVGGHEKEVSRTDQTGIVTEFGVRGWTDKQVL